MKQAAAYGLRHKADISHGSLAGAPLRMMAWDLGAPSGQKQAPSGHTLPSPAASLAAWQIGPSRETLQAASFSPHLCLPQGQGSLQQGQQQRQRLLQQ